MSGENLEIVRQVYDAVARGDSDAVLAAYDPAVEMRFTRSPLRPVMRQEVYRGHDGLRSLFQERPDAWGGLEDICEELIDAGGEQVVTGIRSHGRGRVSGAEVELRHFGLWRFRNGKVVEVSWYGTREDALEAAGVSSGMSAQNLERLRSIYANWRRGDYRDVSWADVGIEFGFADGPNPGVVTGTEAMSAAWRDALTAWVEFCAEPERFIAVDDARALVLTRNTGRGRGSGVDLGEVVTRSANPFHFREGLVTRLIIYFDRDRALADVGLSPEAVSSQPE